MPQSDPPAGKYGPEVVAPGQPPPIQALDSLCAASTIAHEAIYELHRRLRLRDGESRECSQLLAESAEIAAQEVPGAAARAHQLASRWGDEVLLNPEAAQGTLVTLSAEVESCEPTLRALLDRQREIAAALRSRLDTNALD